MYSHRWTATTVAKLVERMQENKFDAVIVIEGNRGLGKTQTKGSKVLMSNGSWKNVEDIKIGDEVISPQPDGSITYEKVVHLHQRFEPDIYDVIQVTRERKKLYSCAKNHEIPILRISHPRKKENGVYHGKRKSIQKLDLYEAQRISQMYSKGSHICSFSSPKVEYKYPNSSINPYCLGVWLGDGHFTKDLGITTIDEPIINAFLEENYSPINVQGKENTHAKTYRFSLLGELAKELTRLGLRYKTSYSKFIPQECMLSSSNYRLELLAGLIDTDGYVMKKKDNHISITTASEQLATDIENLVFSLGGHSRIRKIKKKSQSGRIGDYFTVKISFKDPSIIPLRTKKKERIGGIMKHDPRHVAIQVKKRKEGCMVYGFSLTGKSKWYITDSWMVTHNSTLGYHIANRVKTHPFSPKKDILYKRQEIIDAFNLRWYSTFMADEMINVSFNRDFYDTDQKKLIKIMNMNRDHCNLFIACVPQFQTLDNQIKNLTKMRITVVRRGVGIVQTQNRSIYATDRWDTSVNEKIEKEWLKKGASKPKYRKLTTFRGVITFPDLTEKQRREYEEIKREKRNEIRREQEEEEQTNSPTERIYKLLCDGKIGTRAMFDNLCLAMGLKPLNVMANVRTKMRNEGDNRKFQEFYVDEFQNVGDLGVVPKWK